MPYQICCPNGHVFRVDESLQGRRARCQRCQATFLVPPPPLDDLANVFAGPPLDSFSTPATNGSLPSSSPSGFPGGGLRGMRTMAGTRKRRWSPKSVRTIIMVAASILALPLVGWLGLIGVRWAISLAPGPYRVVRAERAEFLVPFANLSRERGEPVLFGSAPVKFDWGGDQELWFVRPVPDSRQLLVELSVSKSQFPKLELADVTLLGGGEELHPMKFLQPQSSPLTLNLEGTHFSSQDPDSWKRILPSFQVVGKAGDTIRTVKAKVSFTDRSASGDFQLSFHRENSGFFPDQAAATGHLSLQKSGTAVGTFQNPGMGGLRISGEISMPTAPHVTCVYAESTADVTWDQEATGWLTTTSVSSKNASYSTRLRVVCVFALPEGQDAWQLRIRDGEPLPVSVR